jgi:hypothetical protein
MATRAYYEAPHYPIIFSLLLHPLRYKYSPQQPVLKHPLYSFPNVTDQVSHPHKRISKIIVLYTVTLHCVGVALSGLISENFLQATEHRIKHVLDNRHILLYKRYVMTFLLFMMHL